MTVNEKLAALRKLMAKVGIDAYIIPSFDAHQSEYVPEYWKSRIYISGFTGSAGTVVVTMNESGLWTDGRYFIQAENQLSGSEIKLFKMREPGVPTFQEYLAQVLSSGMCVGFDGKVFACKDVETIENEFAKKGKNIIINHNYDLVDAIWEDRPSLPKDKAFLLEEKFAGTSTKDKLTQVRNIMSNKNADYYVVSTLDDIAWLFNVRGNDVANTPVIVSYALISKSNAYWFVDNEKVNDEVKNYLSKNDVTIMGYNEIEEALQNLSAGKTIYFDPLKTSIWMSESISKNFEKIHGKDILINLKTIKNSVEIANLKRCHIKDSVALAKFVYWLKSNVSKGGITEISASDKLTEFRSKQAYYIEPSFDTIAGYKEHAAMMHYKAAEDNQYELSAERFLLVDSGGQYLDGTTDITRTFVLGPVSEEEKKDFTLVLKSHISLARIKYLHGVTGTNLDIIARQPLWEQGLDYKCGTGHGVGFLLSVHEQPQRIAVVYSDTVIEEGMILTNEPGIYKEGKHGIRIENTLLAVNDECTESGQFMRFETISYFPIDLDAVVPEMLTADEKAWLNSYHKDVYAKLSPSLTEEEAEWLKHETREI